MLRMKMTIAVVFVAGCLGGAPKSTTPTDPTPTTPTDPTTPSNPSNPSNPATPSNPSDPLGVAPADTTSGGMDNTFDHDITPVDPFAVLNRIQDQGPPEIP